MNEPVPEGIDYMLESRNNDELVDSSMINILGLMRSGGLVRGNGPHEQLWNGINDFVKEHGFRAVTDSPEWDLFACVHDLDSLLDAREAASTTDSRYAVYYFEDKFLKNDVEELKYATRVLEKNSANYQVHTFLTFAIKTLASLKELLYFLIDEAAYE